MALLVLYCENPDSNTQDFLSAPSADWIWTQFNSSPEPEQIPDVYSGAELQNRPRLVLLDASLEWLTVGLTCMY